MPQTNKDYGPREAAVLVKGYLPHSFESERATEGDIVAMRNLHHGIGFAEMANYLWLRLEGLDRTDMDFLSTVGVEPPDAMDRLEEIDHSTILFTDKKRFSIPLARLKLVAPWIDLDRVRDPDDIYQPFIQVDEETGSYIRGTREPLSVHGLVFDKTLGSFL